MALKSNSSSSSNGRYIPSKPDMKKFKATFNNETITVNYVCLDARSPEEKAADRARGSLKGPAMVFFQGHDQRPKDSYEFTRTLALNSLSGICIVPTCDTPFGDDPGWRGDRGKMVILMETIRRLLDEGGVSVEGFSPIAAMPALINGHAVVPKPDNISGKLCSIGWSHGGILAREFASNYPGAVIGLATVCAAGYKKWKNPGHLLVRFTLEAINSGVQTLTGKSPSAIGSAWGLSCGLAGDLSRSVADSVLSGKPSKLARIYKDISDCARLIDESNAPVGGLKNIAVIFARDDTCIAVDEYGIGNLDHPSDIEIESFWQRYYPSNTADKTTLAFRILPGTHTAPATHGRLYAETVLSALGQGVSGVGP
ncbi:MAG: hypothetical protein AB1724_08585 [Thermodesulfobacteriota bacterium]